MGSNTSTSPNLQDPKYSPNLSGYQIVGQGDTYNIWRNRVTGEQLEEYSCSSASQQDLKYLRDVFEFRYSREHLVSSLYYKENTSQELCSTFYNASVYLQRIPLRLNEINDLPYPDNLHLANSCLKGFHDLYERVGSFTVTQQLIGINMDAQVKVWISGDFGKDKLSFYGEEMKHEEMIMVGEIMAVYERIVDHRTEPESLSHFIMRGGAVGFVEALARLNEYVIRHRGQVPPYLKSVADLRDRGFFKKMPPTRKTRFIGQSFSSMDPSNNYASARFDFLPPSGMPAQIIDTISPIIAAGTVSNIPITTGNISTVPKQITTITNGRTHINGIPVVQNPNARVNTFYSNTPVGGSFPISRSPIKRGVSPVPSQKKVTRNIITGNNALPRPLTPTLQVPSLTPYSNSSITRGANHFSHNRFNAAQTSLVAPVTIPYHQTTLKSVQSDKSLPTQVQNLLKEINEINNSEYRGDTTAHSEYISRYVHSPEKKSKYEDYNFGNVATYSSNTQVYKSYEPTGQGLTNPQLLKLANIQRTYQTSSNQFVNTSYNPSPLYTSLPEVQTSQNDLYSDSKTKSILKNKYQDTGDYGVNRSIINDFKSEFRSQIIPDHKPFDEEHVRTVYNNSRNEFRQMHESKVTKQVETYRANIKVITPDDMRRRGINI